MLVDGYWLLVVGCWRKLLFCQSEFISDSNPVKRVRATNAKALVII